MSETDKIIRRVRKIFYNPKGPFYESDIKPLIEDLCVEAERLKKESLSRWDRSERWRRQADRRLQRCFLYSDALEEIIDKVKSETTMMGTGIKYKEIAETAIRKAD